MAERKRPEEAEPTPPGEDVNEGIDKKHSDDDFLRDLEKAASNKPGRG